MDISPELYNYLVSSGIDVGKLQDEVASQKAKSERIRGMAPPTQGMSVNNGRTFVASSPLAHLASVGGNIMGEQQMQGADQSQSKMRDAQGAQFQQILAQLLRQKAGAFDGSSMGTGYPQDM